MVGSRNSCARPGPAKHAFLLGLLLVTTLCPSVSALNYIAGGPCQSVCSDEVAGTVYDDVRCLDNQYNSPPTLSLKQCVTCQLNSTAVDPDTNATDVKWALFNLRYVLSNCMFGYPQEPVSISSPCQVSCAPLQKAVTYGISNTTNATSITSGLGFCTGGQFDDTTINICATCYSFIPQQLILGNFLQALHIECRSPPVAGRSFYPDGHTIFNASTIAGPTGAAPPPVSNKLSGYKLILAIVIPLVVGIIVLAGICFCCWHFTRKRRARMAASGRMSRFHDGQGQEFSPMTPSTSPPQKFAWSEPEQEMESISVTPKMADSPVTRIPKPKSSPGLGQGRYVNHIADESATPLNNPNRTSYVRNDDPGITVGTVRDPNLHDQFIGGDNRIGSAEVFRAQDGFVSEDTQGGWTR